MLIALALITAAATPAPKPASPAQVAARQRMSQCAKQYHVDKSAGKVTAGQTWPKYYSACSKKLKG